MSFDSPLRYPGGKGRLTNYIKSIFELNDLVGGEYVEPYAGGAGIACSLLLSGHVSKIHLNDLNKSIYAFWYSIMNSTDEFCKLIFDTELTIEEWYKQREIQKDYDSWLSLGFSTFFLNRTNRSGIITAGVIGGLKQDGEWKLDARFNKSNLISRIEKLAQYKKQIKLSNKDAVIFVKETIKKLPEKSLIYFDPPYYMKGQKLYANYYEHHDHLQISSLIQEKITQNWIVSYDYVPEIAKMYKVQSKVYDLSYSAGNRYKGKEIMFFSPNLKKPTTISKSSLLERKKFS